MDHRWLLVAGLAACSPSTPPSPPTSALPASTGSAPTDAPPEASAVAPAASAWTPVPASVRPSFDELAAAWRPLGLDPSRPAARVFYTWTSEEQGKQLRARKQLLFKGLADGPAMSLYETHLWESYNADPWARVLMNPPFHFSRYAWTHPWATRLGGDDKSYGDVLVEVTLKPEALIAVYRPPLPAATRWSFFDVTGQPVSAAEARRRAGQIGAVLHDQSDVPARAMAFREVVLCNETMVESWAIGSESISKRLAAEVDALDRMVRFIRGRAEWAPHPLDQASLSFQAEQRWHAPLQPATTPAELWLDAAAFANPRYRLAETTLDELLGSLRALPAAGPPLVWQPGLPSAGTPAVPPPVAFPPRPRCIPRGTFGCDEPRYYPCRGDQGRIKVCK